MDTDPKKNISNVLGPTVSHDHAALVKSMGKMYQWRILCKLASIEIHFDGSLLFTAELNYGVTQM